MVVHVRVLLCTQRYTQRRLTTYECLQFINLPSFNSLTGQGIPNKTLSTSSKLVTYNASTEGDLLVKQFVRFLWWNAFNWYTNLEPEFIDSWKQMEREFLNHYHSTRHTVSMMELTNMRQWKNELVVNYINHWRSLRAYLDWEGGSGREGSRVYQK